MAKRDKRIEQLKRFPPEMEYATVAKILEDLGAELVRIESSHHHWKAPGIAELITVTVHKEMVKVVYLKKIAKAFKL